ncbi:MAG: GntR family transcriptional regulator [Paenibacillus sp.]|nr:GntR family transcriptional regulator [Paenibacillus sp.]
MQQITGDEYMILKNMACEQIKQYMITNRLQPGAKLPTERDLAEMLGVSRTVVREALGTLETLGYIIKQQGKGIFVKKPDLSPLFHEMLSLWSGDEHQLQNVRNFRIMLEQSAIEWIISNATTVDLDRLYGIIEQSERAAISVKEFLSLDYAFHRELLSLTGNPLFIQLTDVINRYFEMIELKAQNPDVSTVEAFAVTVREHRKLVDLIKAKRKAEAVQMLIHHLDRQ